MGPRKGICQPLMVPNRSMPEPNKATRSKNTASDTTLAIPTLVSSHPRDIGGLSSPTSSHPGHYSEPHQSGVHNKARGANTGRITHLRDSFVSRGVSAQASELLLSSCQSKPTVVTIHCFQKGLVGVSKGIDIPLLDL